MKNQLLLGESKYRKLTGDDKTLTKNQMVKFVYTFHQVLSESIDYNLVSKKNLNNKFGEDDDNSIITLNPIGELALRTYEEKGKLAFNYLMLKKMEEKHLAFYQLLKLCYADSTLKNGLLIFPIYSGLKLGFDKSTFTTNQHVLDYSKALMQKLEDDIRCYTKKKKVSLRDEEAKLIYKLKLDGAIGKEPSDSFDTNKYNAVLSRFRKYWLNYFLKNIYNYEYSFDTFNIWVERAKQVGILHTTEFFPNFSGRLIYPTSIISNVTNNMRVAQEEIADDRHFMEAGQGDRGAKAGRGRVHAALRAQEIDQQPDQQRRRDIVEHDGGDHDMAAALGLQPGRKCRPGRAKGCRRHHGACQCQRPMRPG